MPKETYEYMYNYFYVTKMRAQNYADVFVTPYMRDMAIKSYPFLYEGYLVSKSFMKFMSVLMQAMWAKAK